MKQAGPVRSAMSPHGRHANKTGTNASDAEGAFAASARSRNSGAPTPRQNSGLPGLKIDVRQGIA